MLENYIEYLYREPVKELEPCDIAYEGFYYSILYWTIIFSLLHMLTPSFSRFFFPKWYANLEEKKRLLFPSYLICTLHHVFQVPWAIRSAFTDYNRSVIESQGFNYGQYTGPAATFAMAYFISDTLTFAIEAAFKGDFGFITHHALILSITFSAARVDGFICKWIPHLLLMDTSAFVFNMAWLLRLIDTDKNSIMKKYIILLLELSFVLFFFVTRCVHYPAFATSIVLSDYGQKLGVMRFLLIPFGGLQFYWMFYVIKSIIKKITAPKNKEE